MYEYLPCYHSLVSLSSAKTLVVFKPSHLFFFIGQTTACAVVEAADPFKWAPTSILNTYKVYHNPNLICCGCA